MDGQGFFSLAGVIVLFLTWNSVSCTQSRGWLGMTAMLKSTELKLLVMYLQLKSLGNFLGSNFSQIQWDFWINLLVMRLQSSLILVGLGCAKLPPCFVFCDWILACSLSGSFFTCKGKFPFKKADIPFKKVEI